MREPTLYSILLVYFLASISRHSEPQPRGGLRARCYTSIQCRLQVRTSPRIEKESPSFQERRLPTYPIGLIIRVLLWSGRQVEAQVIGFVSREDPNGFFIFKKQRATISEPP
jgi:hypothetical protein